MEIVKRVLVLSGAGPLMVAFFVTMTASVISSGPAAAEFVRSASRLYVDVQKLSTDPQDKSKYYTYAMIRPRCNRCAKTYFIMSENDYQVRYLGAFRCDKSFQVLNQSTHGMKDILCRNWTNRDGAALARFLRFDPAAKAYK